MGAPMLFCNSCFKPNSLITPYVQPRLGGYFVVFGGQLNVLMCYYIYELQIYLILGIYKICILLVPNTATQFLRQGHPLQRIQQVKK